jgi:ribosomal protein S18 acetylase RimI-like enzyme
LFRRRKILLYGLLEQYIDVLSCCVCESGNLAVDISRLVVLVYEVGENLCVRDEDSEAVIGVCVSYDGADLHRLRKAFIEEAIKEFGIDYSGIDDETEKGELYIDSLAVDERYRNMGIASALLKATCEKAESLNIPSTGLLVDCGNPKAEQLYSKLGFKYLNDTAWGGHKMKHLQKQIIDK